ncbi:MAG: hypothetical protein HQ522_20940 [Bacteroidetes bacterium]|nr:hypothetical protein [Bacteroidota bacterium]
MNLLKELILCFGLTLFFSACNAEKIDIPIDQSDREMHHPFLIVQKDQFQELRDKAVVEPWKSMKEDAIARSSSGCDSEAYDLQYYIGAAALAYILDEGNNKIHATRVKEAILNHYSTLKVKDGGDWGGVVPPMGSFFSAILALDIVYDALSMDEINACENVIKNQIFKIDRKGSWVDVRYGTHGTWDIYKGDRTTPDDNYYNGILHQITPDGVSPVTNHYAWERVGGGNSRVSKSGYMDVLEFTGIDTRYYHNEQIQKFQRWLFGSSVNCAKEMAIFGDMLPTQGISNDMLHRRVVNFDMEAAGYAAWFHKGRPAIGHILTYIVPKQALPEPVVPSSKIFQNGGAFFREKEDNLNGLHAVLYNIKSQDEWHTHNEVNGLGLSAYGNRLLVNGGRLGEPTRSAELNNTLTINGENHKARIGGGIVEGFTTEGLDYAVGADGLALKEEHNRNLILVHANDGAKGYSITFDEVIGAGSEKVNNYLHPANQSSVVETVALAEYTASIDHYPTVNGVNITIYYVTPPVTVNIEKSKSAVPERYPGYPDHNRLEAIYDIDNVGNKNLATIIFPHNTSNPKADFQKISGGDFNACSVTQGNIIDLIFEASAEHQIVSNEIEFQAEFCMTRKIGDSVPFYLVRNGTSFLSNNVGFESDNPLTIYARGTEGVIISKSSKVKIIGLEMGTVQFDSSVSVLSSGKDFIEIQLPVGTSYFK